MGRDRHRCNGMRLGLLVAGLIASLNAFAEIDLTGMWMARIHEDEPERGTATT